MGLPKPEPMKKSTKKTMRKKPIKIERGIPMPPKGIGGPGRPRMYPWDDMKVGDSFFVPSIRSSANIASSKGIAMKRTGFAFSTRSVEGGVRVWRIK